MSYGYFKYQRLWSEKIFKVINKMNSLTSKQFAFWVEEFFPGWVTSYRLAYISNKTLYLCRVPIAMNMNKCIFISMIEFLFTTLYVFSIICSFIISNILLIYLPCPCPCNDPLGIRFSIFFSCVAGNRFRFTVKCEMKGRTKFDWHFKIKPSY